MLILEVKVLSHVGPEFRELGKCKGAMALPWNSHEVRDLITNILADVLSVGDWTNLIPKADPHGDL